MKLLNYLETSYLIKLFMLNECSSIFNDLLPFQAYKCNIPNFEKYCSKRNDELDFYRKEILSPIENAVNFMVRLFKRLYSVPDTVYNHIALATFTRFLNRRGDEFISYIDILWIEKFAFHSYYLFKYVNLSLNSDALEFFKERLKNDMISHKSLIADLQNDPECSATFLSVFFSYKNMPKTSILEQTTNLSKILNDDPGFKDFCNKKAVVKIKRDKDSQEIPLSAIKQELLTREIAEWFEKFEAVFQGSMDNSHKKSVTRWFLNAYRHYEFLLLPTTRSSCSVLDILSYDLIFLKTRVSKGLRNDDLFRLCLYHDATYQTIMTNVLSKNYNALIAFTYSIIYDELGIIYFETRLASKNLQQIHLGKCWYYARFPRDIAQYLQEKYCDSDIFMQFLILAYLESDKNCLRAQVDVDLFNTWIKDIRRRYIEIYKKIYFSPRIQLNGIMFSDFRQYLQEHTRFELIDFLNYHLLQRNCRLSEVTDKLLLFLENPQHILFNK